MARIERGEAAQCIERPFYAKTSEGILLRDPGGCKSCEARYREAGWWGKKDSNLRSHKTADLQSAPFATRDTPPFNSIASPTAELAAAEAMDDINTVSRWRAPGRAVYGGSAMAKSTNASRQQVAAGAQIAIIRNP